MKRPAHTAEQSVLLIPPRPPTSSRRTPVI